MTKKGKYLILVIFLVFFLVVLPLVAFFSSVGTGLKVDSRRAAVVLDMHGRMLEYNPYYSAGTFFRKREPSLTDLLTCIDRAATDDRVDAIVLRILPSGAGVAKCEDLRAALLRFKDTGKEVIAFSPVLVNHHYVLACVSDSIYMPPSGYLMIPGLASSAVFVRGTLDKLGITPNIHRIENYKSAAEMFTEKKRSPESKEMIEWVLADLFDRFVLNIAEGRGQDEDTVRSWIDRGLYSPRRAYANGLIDGIRYWDEIRERYTGKGLRFISSREYMKSNGVAGYAGYGQKIAVIHAQGNIIMGESGFDFTSGPRMGSESVIRELRRAQKNKSIKAVILRVDSPGGDGIAGDMISRQVEMTAREKPVVVSMSDVAASGGYEISYRADRIVALPGSITGSIGSIMGKLNWRGFYDKIGITKDEIGIGEKSLIYSDYRDFTEDEWAVVSEEHWEFYRNWIQEIARFRGMTYGAVDSIARGRIWTGSQAKDKGLIDDVGDFSRSLELACELGGIDDPSRVVIVHLPARMNLLQSILAGGFFDGMLNFLIDEMLRETFLSNDPLFLEHRMPEETGLQ